MYNRFLHRQSLDEEKWRGIVLFVAWVVPEEEIGEYKTLVPSTLGLLAHPRMVIVFVPVSISG